MGVQQQSPVALTLEKGPVRIVLEVGWGGELGARGRFGRHGRSLRHIDSIPETSRLWQSLYQSERQRKFIQIYSGKPTYKQSIFPPSKLVNNQ